MSGMPRKDLPSKFLDASLVPLERALVNRAGHIATEILSQPDTSSSMDDKEAFTRDVTTLVRSVIAEEFQKLAKELHFW